MEPQQTDPMPSTKGKPHAAIVVVVSVLAVAAVSIAAMRVYDDPAMPLP